ncbi:MAG: hypothetical protein R6U67_11085, partial [Sodalinema sp.]|uniref:hypothetical protein n=1 Tax=Sodalinema sp. TaxID=3080550 RepID=UPI00396F49B0
MAEELKVRYRRGIGVTLLMASIFVLLDAFVVSLKGGFPFSLISGFITLYGGYLFVSKTYITLSRHELKLYKLTGRLEQTYSLRSLKDLTLDENRIIYCPKKTETPLPIRSARNNLENQENITDKMMESAYKEVPSLLG